MVKSKHIYCKLTCLSRDFQITKFRELRKAAEESSETKQDCKKTTTINLDVMLDVGEGGQDVNLGLLVGDHVALAGHDGLTLEAGALLTLGAVLGLDGLVLLDAVGEILAALGVTDVLDADVEALLHLAVADDLVDLNTDGVLGNVEDDTSAAVVVGVGHTLLDGGVGDDVDVITTLVLDQVPGKVGHTMLAEGLGELVTRVRAETTGVRHFG